MIIFSYIKIYGLKYAYEGIDNPQANVKKRQWSKMMQLLEIDLIIKRQKDPWGMTEMQKQMGNTYRGDLLAYIVQNIIYFHFYLLQGLASGKY